MVSSQPASRPRPVALTNDKKRLIFIDLPHVNSNNHMHPNTSPNTPSDPQHPGIDVCVPDNNVFLSQITSESQVRGQTPGILKKPTPATIVEDASETIAESKPNTECQITSSEIMIPSSGGSKTSALEHSSENSTVILSETASSSDKTEGVVSSMQTESTEFHLVTLSKVALSQSTSAGPMNEVILSQIANDLFNKNAITEANEQTMMNSISLVDSQVADKMKCEKNKIDIVGGSSQIQEEELPEVEAIDQTTTMIEKIPSKSSEQEKEENLKLTGNGESNQKLISSNVPVSISSELEDIAENEEEQIVATQIVIESSTKDEDESSSELDTQINSEIEVMQSKLLSPMTKEEENQSNLSENRASTFEAFKHFVGSIMSSAVQAISPQLDSRELDFNKESDKVSSEIVMEKVSSEVVVVDETSGVSEVKEKNESEVEFLPQSKQKPEEADPIVSTEIVVSGSFDGLSSPGLVKQILSSKIGKISSENSKNEAISLAPVTIKSETFVELSSDELQKKITSSTGQVISAQ